MIGSPRANACSDETGRSAFPARCPAPTAPSNALTALDVPGPAAPSMMLASGIASPKTNRPPRNVSDRMLSCRKLKSAPNFNVCRPVTRMRFCRTWKTRSVIAVGRMKSLPKLPKPLMSIAGPSGSVGRFDAFSRENPRRVSLTHWGLITTVSPKATEKSSPGVSQPRFRAISAPNDVFWASCLVQFPRQKVLRPSLRA